MSLSIRHLTITSIFGFFTVITAMNAAIAGDWAVARATGQIWIGGVGVQQVALQNGAEVPAGASVTTSANGRALLVHGDQKMLVSPNSTIVLPSADNASTTVLQAAGEILLDVDRRDVRHFSVETPYLAAVVKGTQFKVKVTPNGARVEVVGGRVLVSNHSSGKQAEIGAGQSASSDNSNAGGLRLGGTGTLPEITQGVPRPPVIKPPKVNANGQRVFEVPSPGQLRRAGLGLAAQNRGSGLFAGLFGRNVAAQNSANAPRVGLLAGLFGGEIQVGYGNGQGNAYGLAAQQAGLIGNGNAAGGKGKSKGKSGGNKGKSKGKGKGKGKNK